VVGRSIRVVVPAVAAGAAATVHALAALRLDGRAPTAGEANLAAAVFAVHDGRIGAIPLPFPEALAARQLAAVTALLPSGATSVFDSARIGVLALGALTAVLLWPVLRRLGCSAPATALAVAVVGIAPPVVALHAVVTPAAVAVPWLLGAGLFAAPARARIVAATVAVLLAVLTLPLVGAVLLATAAHWVADRTLGWTLPAGVRWGLVGVLGCAAIVLAVAASGAGPLAGAATPAATSEVGAAVAAGVLVVLAAWWTRWVRPLLTPLVLLLAVALVPGPGRVAAALLGAPLLALLVAAVADDTAVRLSALSRVRPVLAAAAPVAVLAVVMTATTATAAPSARALPADPTPATLRLWLDEQLGADVVLHADPLDRAALLAAGFPAERLGPLSPVVPHGGARLVTERVADKAGVAPAPCPASALIASLPRWQGGPAELCGDGAAVDADPPDLASRQRFGSALAGNPRIQLADAAAELLTAGRVDPRIMIVLGALASAHTVTVPDFPLADFQPPTAARRHLLVSALDGQPTTGDASSHLRDWLDRQHAPFAPAVRAAHSEGLLVGFRGPPPPNLLPA
jgi:hypothetical protein